MTRAVTSTLSVHYSETSMAVAGKDILRWHRTQNSSWGTLAVRSEALKLSPESVAASDLLSI